MSTQGQGDVVERLDEWIRTTGTLDPDDYHTSIRAQDVVAAREEITRLRTLLSSSRGEQGWLPIEHAPKTRPIIGKTAAGRIVKAKWVRLDDDNAGWGTPEEDDPRPNCWDDGFCWASNSDEQPSDQLVAYIEMPSSAGHPASDALSAERARVIEECAAIVSERLARYKSRGMPDCDPTGVRAAEASGILAALRALGQQDTGGSNA